MRKYTRKAGSVLLTLALLLALLPCGVTLSRADGEDDWQEVNTWEALEGCLINNVSKIRLTASVKPTAPDRSSPLVVNYWNADITLDLNGCSIDRSLTTPKEHGSVIEVLSGKLTITDSSNRDHGCITGGSTTGDGGGIYVKYGTVTLETVSVKNCSAALAGGGVCLYCNAEFTLDGGSIEGNTAKYGGGVFVSRGDGGGSQFTMYGGSISGNGAFIGSGVYAEHGMVELSGAFINDNMTPIGAGKVLGGGVVVSEQSSVAVAGTVMIKDNSGGNLILIGPEADVLMSVTSPWSGVVLDDDACIGISKYVVTQSDPENNPLMLVPEYPVGGAFTGGMSEKMSKSNFFSDLDCFTVDIVESGYYEGEAELVAKTYNITYDLAGGSLGNHYNPETYTVSTGGFSLCVPTRNGYYFAGWIGTGLTEPTMVVYIPRGSIGDRSYTATWTSEAPAVPVTGVTVTDYYMNGLPLGCRWKATAVVSPSNATNKAVIWTSSDPEVAVVDQNGWVTAVGNGTATITAATVDGGFSSDQEFGTVAEFFGAYCAMDVDVASVEAGGTLQLYANHFPDAESITWESTDDKTASVDQNGLVTCVKTGSVTITATLTFPDESFSYSTTCRVTVTPANTLRLSAPNGSAQAS
ncbi:MAG: Ig-like domain-containing protein, partial [Oscillospiraceae bacterium]|nr:Ig-like domain-containing protein [Oscillospiraceae bacterium]